MGWGPNTTVAQLDLGGIDNQITFATAGIPEPSTYAMMGVCLIGMAGYGWRRRKLKAA